MSSNTVRVFVRRPDGTTEGLLDTYSQLDAIDRDLDAGSWSITAPSSDLMQKLATPSWGAIIMIDDYEFLAGPTSQIEQTADKSSPEGKTVVSGLSDSARLWEYLIYPSAPLFTASAYDSITAPGETMMKYFVWKNLLDDSRKVPGIAQYSIAADKGRGITWPINARFDNLGDMCVSIGISTNLGFDIKRGAFDVYEHVDRSAEVDFSFETGNLIEFKSKRTRPKANRTVVGGGGEGTARAFEIVEDDASAATWGAYMESFRDRRDTVDSAELYQSGVEELVKNGEKNDLSVRVIDVPNRTYCKNYNKGDIITAQRIRGRLAQIQLTADEKGHTIVPSVNSANYANAMSVLTAYDELRRQRLRIAHLERSL